MYNQSEPPEYDLASVDVPIAIYYGDQGGNSIGLKKLGDFLGAYLGAYLGAPHGLEEVPVVH